jgi:hypothetical protein
VTADEAKLRALTHRITTGEATEGDLEAARQLLAASGYSTVSADLFKLADAARCSPAVRAAPNNRKPDQ